MKKSKHLPASFCIALLSTAVAAATEVGLLVEHIELPEKAATQLLLKGGSPIKLRAEIDRQIAAGDAQITDVAYLLRPVLSAQKMAEISKENEKTKNYARDDSASGSATSVLEYIYPTEWDPAQVVAEIEVDVTANMDLKLPPNPTAFDVRNIGNQLGISAQRNDDGALLLELVTDVTYLAGLREYGNGEDTVTQPRFTAKVLKTKATAKHREPIFLGMHTPRAAAERDRRMLVFATPLVKEQAPRKPARAKINTSERTITVGVEMIEVSQAQLGQLLASKPGERREFTAGVMKNGNATLLGSGVLKSTPGQRAKIEPVHEFIYPTEYDPAEIVQKLTRQLLESGKYLKTSAAPTAFDVRNLGMTIEAEADLFLTADDGEMIEVSVRPELIDLAARTIWGKEESRAEMPLVRNLSCDTKVSIQPGGDALAAILTPRITASGKPDGQRRVLVFVWADVTPG